MPKFLIVMCICGIFATVTVRIAGHTLGALMYLKTKTLKDVHLSSFLQLLRKAVWVMF